MKVLDLRCANGHVFEGWFGSEEDFASQSARSLVQCPACGDSDIAKKPSAPRLNLSGSQAATQESVPVVSALPAEQNLVSAWLQMARQVVENTTDVGNQFAEEARKIHYHEVEPKGIRGTATPQEARELHEEGIAVLPLMLPESVKGTLQ